MNDEDRPITLNEACSIFQGSLTPSTLWAEHGRGRLAIFKIGRRYYTTRNDVELMVSKCRENQPGQGSNSTRNETRGPSETVQKQSAQVALDLIVSKLKKGLPIT